MLFRELTSDEFNYFSKINNASFYQTSYYGNVMKTQNYTPIYLGLLENNKIIAASLILITKEEGFYYAYAPKGFILDYNNQKLLSEFTNNVKKYLGSKNIIAVKLNPEIIRNIYNFKTQNVINKDTNCIYQNLINNKYYHLGYNNYFEALKPRFEAIIDLSISINNLFLNIKKQYRTKIRNAINNGIEIYQGNINDVDKIYMFTKDKYHRDLNYFKSIFTEFNTNVDLFYTKLNTMKYLKYIQKTINKYEKELAKLNAKLNNNNKLINKKIHLTKYLNNYKKDLTFATQLLRNYPDGIITASIIIIKNNNNASILIDGYDKNLKRLNSKHLLIWHLINYYKNLNFNILNLGGMSNITIDNNKYVGLDEFKLNFGANMYEYLGDFELITNKRSYNLYRNYVPFKNIFKKFNSK